MPDRDPATGKEAFRSSFAAVVLKWPEGVTPGRWVPTEEDARARLAAEGVDPSLMGEAISRLLGAFVPSDVGGYRRYGSFRSGAGCDVLPSGVVLFRDKYRQGAGE